MGRFVNPDHSAFQVALNSKIYVDKTGFLKYTNSVLDTTDGYICNSRPRRFGKSYTANMLSAYYSRGADSREMFCDLEISRDSEFGKHLNCYDVIHLDIQWFLANCEDPDEVVHVIQQNVIDELYGIYPGALPEGIRSLPDALSRVREASGRKFIIIIDEWDVMIRDASVNSKAQEKYIHFLRSMFKGTEPTRYIQLAYLTGILPIKKETTQSALNNFKSYTMLNAGPLAQYVGFTENEVRSLCQKYERNYEEVKEWYDGYQLGKEHVYNPNAVVNVMLEGDFQSYWSGTASYETIVPLINMDFDGLKRSVIRMLSGDNVLVDVSSFQNDTENLVNRDDVLTYLIHLGYLGYMQKGKLAFIPNEEIRRELIRATQRKKWNELTVFLQKSEELLNQTLAMNEKAVAGEIEAIHATFVPAIQYNDENSLSSVLTIAYLSAMQYYFKPVREMPAGKGFADFVFVPKMEYKSCYPALILELKWDKTAQTALQQMMERKYPDALKAYTGEILLVGINYNKKTKEHECLIEKME